MSAQIIHGDCLEKLRDLPDNSVDSLVSDAPGAISFMGKNWDSDKGGRDHWIAWVQSVMVECLRVLKPGAHGLVWGLPRASHWTATALENAGFEIRDVVTHCFGTGFPKSLDISKAIDKASGAEREVIGKSDNWRPSQSKGGAGFDATVGSGGGTLASIEITAPSTDAAKQWQGWGTALKPACEMWILVRKPCSEKTVAANVLKWGLGGINVDGCRIDGKPRTTHLKQEASRGGASRFFYVAKASKSDKGEGNAHPTVKSQALMSYLIKLVTPPNGTVLDPFMGSGSTGVAAVKSGFSFIGIELEDEYVAIAQKRLSHAEALLAKASGDCR